MVRLFPILIIFLIFTTVPLAADFVLSIKGIEGTVQIKREESRKWETLQKGDEIADNDQVQTSFKSKCELDLGNDNIVFLGANSRMLVNKVEKPDKSREVSLTLFAGSVYSKINRNLDFIIYTSTATAHAKAAIFNCSVDEVTGITGFHIFKGSITASNIAVQGETELKSGETSTIAPGTPPSTSKKISAKQMSVLTRFYGSDFINQEIEATGVEVVSGSSKSEAAPVQTQEVKEEAKPKKDPSQASATSKMPRLFDDLNLRSRLKQNEKETNRMYEEVSAIDPLKEYRYRFDLPVALHFYNSHNYLDFAIRQGMVLKDFQFMMNIPIVADSSGRLQLTFQDLRALFDKIGYVRYKKGYFEAKLDELKGMTLGRGLSMENYTNRAASDNVRNLGLYLRYNPFCEYYTLFTSDISNFHLVGFHALSDDSVKQMEFVLIRDLGEEANRNNGDFSFRHGKGSFQAATPKDSIRGSVPVMALEASGLLKLIRQRPMFMNTYFGLSTIVIDDQKVFDNAALILPGIDFGYGRNAFSFELMTSTGRFIRGYFGNLYEDNLYRIRKDSTGRVISGLSLASALVNNNTTLSFRTAVKTSPLKGVTLSVGLGKNLAHVGRVQKIVVGKTKNDTSYTRKLVSGREDGSFDANLRVGNGFFLPRLVWLNAYYQARHIGYFENGSFKPFTPNTFTMSGVDLRVLVQRNIEARFSYENYYYDNNGNFIAESTEKVSGFSVGATIGF